MKTPDLIKSLVQDLRPVRRAPTRTGFLLRWLLITAITAPIALMVLPVRGDWSGGAKSGFLALSVLLWLAAAVTSALAVYQDWSPGAPRGHWERAALLSLVGLVMLCAFGHSSGAAPQAWTGQWPMELDAWRGRCGFLIAGIGLLGGLVFLGWVKRAAPTRPAQSGAWILISTGCVASFVICFVCPFENPVHLLIWHLLPVLLLGSVGAVLGRRLLRW